MSPRRSTLAANQDDPVTSPAPRRRAKRTTTRSRVAVAVADAPVVTAAAPVTPRGDWRRALVPAALILILIIIGWVWSLPYQLRQSTATDGPIPPSEWEQLKKDMKNSVSEIKTSLTAIRQEQAAQPVTAPVINLSPAATAQIRRELIADRTGGWMTYANFDAGWSIQYPATWQRTVAADGQSMTITDGAQSVVIQLTAVSPTPAETPTAFFLDTLTANRYTPADVTAAERIIAPWPTGGKTMVLSGRGEMFDLMALTFTLLDPMTGATE